MALKVITPSANTGFDAVGADDYRAGMIAARDSSGNVVVCGGTNDPSADRGKKPIGILGEDRLTSTAQDATQVGETLLGLTVGQALAHDSHLLGTSSTSPSLVAIRGSDTLTLDSDYSINGITGVITFIGGGAHTVLTTDTVSITYTFTLNDQFEKDFRGVNFKGALDDTEGSKKATVWKGYGEFETDQFDTIGAYTVGAPLYCTKSTHALGAGLFALTSGNTGTTIVGHVNKLPTAASPFLGVTWNPALVA